MTRSRHTPQAPAGQPPSSERFPVPVGRARRPQLAPATPGTLPEEAAQARGRQTRSERRKSAAALGCDQARAACRGRAR
jgi:hypothetical protein